MSALCGGDGYACNFVLVGAAASVGAQGLGYLSVETFRLMRGSSCPCKKWGWRTQLLARRSARFSSIAATCPSIQGYLLFNILYRLHAAIYTHRICSQAQQIVKHWSNSKIQKRPDFVVYP